LTPEELNMDLPQLKLLAGSLRGLLDQRGVSVVHGQALDLIAAVPGLRNWPEVLAFPDRVAACRLDASTASRLAFRLVKRHHLELSPEELVQALDRPGADTPRRAPQVWPGGPTPGVYVTTSADAISTLLRIYEEATDGELVYAERAGNHWEGAIDLGENGLWSDGLDRVPSGTLLVLGPLELTQQDWDDSASTLEMACLRALNSGHRVAVLVNTPTPSLLFKDLERMVQAVQPEGEDYEAALMGVVTAGGDLQRLEPFAKPVAAPRAAAYIPDLTALPPEVVPMLEQALKRRTTGLLAVGSNIIQEHWAIELVSAVLPLSEHLGPAARIKPRNRSTPAKDWQVPDAVKALPMLPSIESAYEHGFRRMVVGSFYTKAEVMLRYADEVLFLTGCHGNAAADVFLGACRGSGRWEEVDILSKTVALLGVSRIDTSGAPLLVPDLYQLTDQRFGEKPNLEELLAHISANRVLRWEDGLEEALLGRKVKVSALRKAFERDHAVKEFLSARKRMKAAA
jgi:hypothetical protein